MTGSMPGIAASTSETWLFGSPPNAVEAPENSFALEVTWAWISMPITTSQSPVCPLISLPLATAMSLTLAQRGDDPLPFGLERILGSRLAGLPIPVAGIGQVALDPMQIGMHPGGIGVALVLHDLVRGVPVALRRPPERRERRLQSRRWPCFREARFEIGHAHHHFGGVKRPAAC